MARSSKKFPVEVSRYWDLVPEGGWLIYALTDPTKDNAIRYVGYTGCRKYNRLWFHLNNALIKRSSRRSKWIYGLLKRDLIPGFQILEQGSGEWEERERYWIKSLRAQGADLVNASDGGRGPAGNITPRKTLIEKRAKYFENHCAVFVGRKREPNRSIVKPCEKCGKLFFSRLLRGVPKSKCYSHACLSKLLVGYRKPPYAEKRTCPYCRSQFMADYWQIKRATSGPYCSIPCAKKHHWWLGKMTPKQKGPNRKHAFVATA